MVSFIDRQLATRQKKALGDWRAGLRASTPPPGAARESRSRICRSNPRRHFSRTSRQGQGEKADWGDVDPARFFRRLRDHTMMGFYGDPRHGGNRDRVAWRMLGVPDPPIRGRLHETPATAPAATRGRAERWPGLA